MTFLTNLGVIGKPCSFRLVLDRKAAKKIPESSSRFQFLEKTPARNFALSDPEDNTSDPLSRDAIAYSKLLRTILAIHLKSRNLKF